MSTSRNQRDVPVKSDAETCEKSNVPLPPTCLPAQQNCGDPAEKQTPSSPCGSASLGSCTTNENMGYVQEPACKATTVEREVRTGPAVLTDWKATTLLVGFYLIALLVAILHAVMIRYLDGKPTDDKKYMYLAQPYVTSVNILLVAAFKASLCASLTIAFTQHLWRVMRTKALAVFVIESLHGARSNPFLLAAWRVGYRAPLLYMMALLMWLLTVAILFPPSALTVIHDDFQEQMPCVVPTFDAAYGQDFGVITTLNQKVKQIVIGNSSLSSWIPLTKMESPVNVTSMTYLFPNSKLWHLSHIVLVSGDVPASQSPCGLNCAYTINFKGPIFRCNTTAWNETAIYEPGTDYQYYSGRWEGPYNRHSTFTSLKLNVTRLVGIHDQWLIQEIQTLHCQPAWADYSVDMLYKDGLRTFSTTTIYGKLLADTFVKGAIPTIQGVWLITTPTTNVDWSPETIRTLEALNNYAILDSIVASLAGSHDQIPVPTSGPAFTSTILNGTELAWKPLEAGFTWYNSIHFFNGTQWTTYESKEILPNRTVIRDTHFNLHRDNWADTRPSFKITEEVLNDIVANVTVATMLGYFPVSTLNQTVTANVTTSRNIYSFSRPLNLILPYALSLVFSLPFLVIGYVSLGRNGSAAQSDSFIQLLLTMTRSEELDCIAMSAAGRGDEAAQKELKQTKIMFGELVDQRGRKARRKMGFGLEHEIVRSSK